MKRHEVAPPEFCEGGAALPRGSEAGFSTRSDTPS